VYDVGGADGCEAEVLESWTEPDRENRLMLMNGDIVCLKERKK
jgi:hypothetical protein